jgi:hypothetical protein
LPRGETSGRLADIGAIKIEANTLAQLRHHVFAQTGIGASCTRLGAVKALFDAAYERGVAEIAGLRVGYSHFLGVHKILLLLLADPKPY